MRTLSVVILLLSIAVQAQAAAKENASIHCAFQTVSGSTYQRAFTFKQNQHEGSFRRYSYAKAGSSIKVVPTVISQVSSSSNLPTFIYYTIKPDGSATVYRYVLSDNGVQKMGSVHTGTCKYRPNYEAF